jgi:septum site-determining protein MinC
MALVLAPEPPVADWLHALDAQIARAPSFFDARPVIVDLAALPREQPDVAGLIQAMAERGIRIIGTEGAHPSWHDVAKWGGPILASGKGRPVEVPDEPRATPAETTPPAAAPAPAESTASEPPAASLVIAQTVRSGQSIVHEAGDVTIIGSVASGAEIVAGGSIHIYGALRGRAIAGLGGSRQARIFCSRLHAELLAIEGVYKTADDMDPKLHDRSIQAWLDGEHMSIAAMD